MTKIVAVGDIMLGEEPDSLGLGVQSIIKNNKEGFLFQNIKTELIKGDIVFGNLEAVLSDYNLVKKNLNSVKFRGLSSSAVELKNSGFNIMAVANNHFMEHGEEAFYETLSILKKNGIKYFGLKDEKKFPKPLISVYNGIKIGFLATSDTVDNNTDNPIYYKLDDNIFKIIKNLKKEVDFIVLSIHWGYEHIEKPSPEQIFLGRKFIDSGVNLVLGHHSHCIQGFEEYNNGLIVYSLGNFVFEPKYKVRRRSWLFEIEIEKNKINRYKYKPVFINKNCQPEIASKKIVNQIKNVVKIANQYIASVNTIDDDLINKYRKEAMIARKKFRQNIKLKFFKNFFKLPFWVQKQNILEYLKKTIKIF